VFKNRCDAGRRLAKALEPYAGARAVVLAIPKGGIEVGYEVARHLGAEFSIVVSRKLPFEDNPESGYGAVAEDGSVFLHEELAKFVPEDQIQRSIQAQQREIERRIAVLRKGRPLPDLAGRTVILVDDGVAVGSTMRASIRCCKNRGAAKTIVAAPVSSRAFYRAIKSEVDEAVVLETPGFFRAVADVYARWYDVSDDEAVRMLERFERERGGAAGS
jgi:predicted phosphoribosyltransferase